MVNICAINTSSAIIANFFIDCILNMTHGIIKKGSLVAAAAGLFAGALASPGQAAADDAIFFYCTALRTIRISGIVDASYQDAGFTNLSDDWANLLNSCLVLASTALPSSALMLSGCCGRRRARINNPVHYDKITHTWGGCQVAHADVPVSQPDAHRDV